MIIDVHHHMFRLNTDQKKLAVEAERRYARYGPGARSQAVDVTLEDIRQRLAPFYGLDFHVLCQNLLQIMAQAGIDITVLSVVDSIEEGLNDEEVLSANRACADIAALSHGKLITLAAIDPRRKEAPELFRRCIEDYGMGGLKFHPDWGFYPNSEEAYAVLKVAEKLGTPVLIHTGPWPRATERRGHQRAKFAEVIHLDDVAQDFPGLKVIAAHMGRFAWRDWASLAQCHRNLYGDLAMWQIFAVVNYERFCRDLREILDIAGTDSVLFGSDGPGCTAIVPNEDFVRILRDLPRKAPPGVKFTEEEVEGILGENARKVFGL